MAAHDVVRGRLLPPLAPPGAARQPSVASSILASSTFFLGGGWGGGGRGRGCGRRAVFFFLFQATPAPPHPPPSFSVLRMASSTISGHGAGASGAAASPLSHTRPRPRPRQHSRATPLSSSRQAAVWDAPPPARTVQPWRCSSVSAGGLARARARAGRRVGTPRATGARASRAAPRAPGCPSSRLTGRAAARRRRATRPRTLCRGRGAGRAARAGRASPPSLSLKPPRSSYLHGASFFFFPRGGPAGATVRAPRARP